VDLATKSILFATVSMSSACLVRGLPNHLQPSCIFMTLGPDHFNKGAEVYLILWSILKLLVMKALCILYAIH